jgi:hypothetical protein
MICKLLIVSQHLQSHLMWECVERLTLRKSHFCQLVFFRRSAPRPELRIEHVKRHLAFAFNGFLGREISAEGVDQDKAEKMKQAQALLKEAFELPDDEDDETLRVTKTRFRKLALF